MVYIQENLCIKKYSLEFFEAALETITKTRSNSNVPLQENG